MNGLVQSLRSNNSPTSEVNEAEWPADELEHVEKCPLCGSAQRQALYRDLADRVFFCAPGRWTLYQCQDCEAAYLDPRPTPKSIGKAYQSYYTHSATGEFVPKSLFARAKRILRNGYLNAKYGFGFERASVLGAWIMPFLLPGRCQTDRVVRHLPLDFKGARLLDVGCGNGGFIKLARDWGWDAEGLEPDWDAAAVGRAAGLSITVGTLPNTGFADNSFTAVTMSHVIEHLHDPIASLREIYRILKPGGRVWIATPNIKSIGHKFFADSWRGLEPPRHLVLFTPSSLATALQEAGFKQIRHPKPAFKSREMFEMSSKIARSVDPYLRDEPRNTKRIIPLAIMADWLAFFHPNFGEEMVMIGSRPQ